MNQNVASYPSVVGVPDCIEERITFDASLAQVVGSSARWSSYESRYQSGIVTGSALLTDPDALPRDPFAIIGDRIFPSHFLGRTIIADLGDRSVVTYRYNLDEKIRPVYDYNIRRQMRETDERGVIKDWSGNGRDATFGGRPSPDIWTDDGLQFQTSYYAVNRTRPTFTEFSMIVDVSLAPGRTFYPLSVCSNVYPNYTPWSLVVGTNSANDYRVHTFGSHRTTGLRAGNVERFYFTSQSFNGTPHAPEGVADVGNIMTINDFRPGRNSRSVWKLRRMIIIDKLLDDETASRWLTSTMKGVGELNSTLSTS